MDLFAKALKTKKVKEVVESVIEKVEEFNKKSEIELGEGISKDSVIDLDKKKKSKKLSITSKKKMNIPKGMLPATTKTKKGRIYAFVGKHGTGKTKACCDFAQRFKKTLYIDTEYKVSEILDEHYQELIYDMKEPIIHDNIPHSKIFKDTSDVHIDVAQVIDKTTGKRDDVATIQYIIKNTPLYLKLIKSGKYKNVIIDSLSPIGIYAVKKWLKINQRQRVTKFEYSEVEAIKQDIILPFVNYCKIYNVNLILTSNIVGHYLNDIVIGYKEEVKQWLLSIFSYELWFEYDYHKYCIKHPYRPFWAIQDEDMDISEYLFNNEFIDDETEDKEFEEFKYESMTSESYRKEVKTRNTSLKIGSKS